MRGTIHSGATATSRDGVTRSRVLVPLACAGAAAAVALLAHRLHSSRHSELLLLLSTLAGGDCDAAAAAQEQPIPWDYAESHEELLVEARLPPHTRRQDVAVVVQRQWLRVSVGRQRVIDGPLAGRVCPARSSWHAGGQGRGRKLSVTLVKAPAGAAAAGGDSTCSCSNSSRGGVDGSSHGSSSERACLAPGAARQQPRFELWGSLLQQQAACGGDSGAERSKQGVLQQQQQQQQQHQQ